MLSKYEAVLNVCIASCIVLYTLRSTIRFKHSTNYTKPKRWYVNLFHSVFAKSALSFMYMLKTTCRLSIKLCYAFKSLICKTPICNFSDSHCFVLAQLVFLQARSMVSNVVFSKLFVTKVLNCFSYDMQNRIDALISDSHFSMPCKITPVSTTAQVFYCYLLTVTEASVFMNRALNNQTHGYYQSLFISLQLLMQPKNLLVSFYHSHQTITSACLPTPIRYLYLYIRNYSQINNKQMPEQSTVQFYSLLYKPFSYCLHHG